MSHTISIPVSRYSVAGFLSVLTTLALFLALFEAIQAPNHSIIITTPAPPRVFTPLEPSPPKEPKEIEKPEYKPLEEKSIISTPQNFHGPANGSRDHTAKVLKAPRPYG